MRESGTAAQLREINGLLLRLLAEYGYVAVEEIVTAEEDIIFSLPKELRAEMKKVGDTDRSLGGRHRSLNG